MKKYVSAFFVTIGLMAAVAFPAAAGDDPYDGTGVYSKATPNCVPAVHALLWYDIGYRLFLASLPRDRETQERNMRADGATPACWLGKASAAVGVRHRLLYLPSESRKIRAWFAQNN